MKNILKLVVLLITMNSCGYDWIVPQDEYENTYSSRYFHDDVVKLLSYSVGDTILMAAKQDTIMFTCTKSKYENDGFQKLYDEKSLICNNHSFDYLWLEIKDVNNPDNKVTLNFANSTYGYNSISFGPFLFEESNGYLIEPEPENPIQFYGNYEDTVIFKPITSIDSITYQDVNIIFNKEEKDTVYFNHTYGFLRFRNETVDYKLVPN